MTRLLLVEAITSFTEERTNVMESCGSDGAAPVPLLRGAYPHTPSQAHGAPLTSRKVTKRTLNISSWGLSKVGSFLSQHSTKGMSPRMLGSRYTMPQRETVAGEATARS